MPFYAFPLRRIRPVRDSDLPAEEPGEQGAGGGLRQALPSPARAWPACSTRCRRSWRPRDFRAVVAALIAARAAGRGDRLGVRRARDQDRALADPDRPDGARLRLGARDQRRRPHPRLRDRAVGRDVRGRRRQRSATGRFGMADETGRLLNGAINDGVAAGLGLGQAVGRLPVRAAPAARARSSVGGGGLPAGDPPDGARRHRHRHHPHAPGGIGRGARRRQPPRLPVLRVERVAPREGRLSQLRVGRRSCPRCSSRPCRWRATAGCRLDGLTTVTIDFARLYRPQVNVVSRPTAGIGRGLLPGRPPRTADSAARGRAG